MNEDEAIKAIGSAWFMQDKARAEKALREYVHEQRMEDLCTEDLQETKCPDTVHPDWGKIREWTSDQVRRS